MTIPVITEAAGALVKICDRTPGAPPCDPRALANVLEHIGFPITDLTAATLQALAHELRDAALTKGQPS
mgnify:CR=1 FL=1